jgi:hypothetical protein
MSLLWDRKDAAFWRKAASHFDGRSHFGEGLCWFVHTFGADHGGIDSRRRGERQLTAVRPARHSKDVFFWWPLTAVGDAERATACALLATLCEADAFDAEGNLR